MTAQVIFLNTNYFPDVDEQIYLDMLQDKLHFANIAFVQALRDKPEWEVRIRKEDTHKRARGRLHVVRRDA